MTNHDDHPTYQSIPQQYRSVWYRIPGYKNLDRRSEVTFNGRGLFASTTIEGIRNEGDTARVGDIIPYRYLDEAVRQGRHMVFLRPLPSGYGLEPVEPTAAELTALYEKFPAMKPAVVKAPPRTKKTEPIDEQEHDE